MNSEQKKSENDLETVAVDVGSYGIKAYGAGYLLLILGGGLSGAISFFSPWYIGSSFFLFLAWLSALIFAAQIIFRSRDIQRDISELRARSLPLTAFSMTILFLGIVGITVHAYARSISYPLNVALLFPSVISIASVIILMIGFNVYSRELTASKVVGGILILIPVFLLYFVSLIPWKEIWSSVGRSYPFRSPDLPPLPGPLLCESNIEAVALLLTAACGFLFALPAFKEERSRLSGKMIVSSIVILFSAGLMLFNYSAATWVIGLTSMASSEIFLPLSLALLGFLVLIISSLMLIISGSLSLAGAIKTFSARPQRKDVIICPNCRSQIPFDSTYCPKCGKKIANESAVAPLSQG